MSEDRPALSAVIMRIEPWESGYRWLMRMDYSESEKVGFAPRKIEAMRQMMALVDD